MLGRTKFDVTPDKKTSEWVVKSGGNADRYRTKVESVNTSTKTERSTELAQVVIREKDGSIQSERTYGMDPQRSRG